MSLLYKVCYMDLFSPLNYKTYRLGLMLLIKKNKFQIPNEIHCKPSHKLKKPLCKIHCVLGGYKTTETNHFESQYT